MQPRCKQARRAVHASRSVAGERGLALRLGLSGLALAAATAGHLCVTSLIARGHSVIGQLDSANLSTVARSSANSTVHQSGVDLSPLQATLNSLIVEVQALNSAIGQQDEREAMVDATQKLEEAADELRIAAQLFVDSIDQPYVVTIERQKRKSEGDS